MGFGPHAVALRAIPWLCSQECPPGGDCVTSCDDGDLNWGLLNARQAP